jgi:hypothetical protein
MTPQQANTEAQILSNPDVNAPGKIGPGYLSDSSRLGMAATDAATWLAPELKAAAALKGMAGLVPKAAQAAEGAISDFPALLKSHGPDFANASVLDHQGNILHNPIGRESVGGPMLRVNEDGSITRGVLAYHGSPHDFDRFDLSRIGTGEGAQAYGHGLYFAENENVAADYKKKLSNLRLKMADDLMQELAKSPQYKGPGLLGHATDLMSGKTSLESVPENIRETVGNILAGPRETPGKLYQVAIKADPEHFLDWDKPLSEQPELFQKLKDAGIIDEKSPPYQKTGQATPQALVATHGGGPERMESRLRSAGIPGIKYLDQQSRGANRWIAQHPSGGINDFPNEEAARDFVKRNPEYALKSPEEQRSRNYVVFDDSMVDILKKYGLAGLAALPAIQAAQQRQAVPLSSLAQ